MKNISYVINGVFAVAIIILFILVFKSNETADKNAEAVSLFSKTDSSHIIPVAYVTIDSIITKYKYAIDENARLLEEWKKMTGILEGKEKEFQREYAAFQKRLERNAFIGQDEYDQERMRISKLQASYEELGRKRMGERNEDEAIVNAAVADSIITNIRLYNETANYHIIFSNTRHDNILVAGEEYDVTDKVISLLNSRYTKK